jgi:hypothetical protein
VIKGVFMSKNVLHALAAAALVLLTTTLSTGQGPLHQAIDRRSLTQAQIDRVMLGEFAAQSNRRGEDG